MMEQNMKQIFLTLTLLTSSALLVSCAGQNSDALKDYRDVKATPKTDQKSESQTTVINPFTIQIKGAGQNNYAQFVEGKPSTFTIILIPQQFQTTAVTNSTLEILEFPSAFTKPQITKKSAFEYDVTWTPQVGVIKPGAIVEPVQLAVLAKPSDERLRGLGTEKALLLMVSKSVGTPKILSVDGLPETAKEGDKIKFHIDIEDPTYDGSKKPKISFPEIFNYNVEGYVASAGTYNEENLDQKINPYQYPGTKRFRYYFVMNLAKTLPHDYDRTGKLDLNSPSVLMCFDIHVISSNGTVLIDSSGKPVESMTTTTAKECVRAFYSAQPALVTWQTQNRQVIAGKANEFVVDLKTQNGLSKILPLDVKQLNSLKGTKSIDCNSQEPATDMQCKITWTPETVCGKKDRKGKQVAFPQPKKVNVKLKITTDLNGTKKDVEEVVEFEVLDSESNCAEVQVVTDAQTENKP